MNKPVSDSTRNFSARPEKLRSLKTENQASISVLIPGAAEESQDSSAVSFPPPPPPALFSKLPSPSGDPPEADTLEFNDSDFQTDMLGEAVPIQLEKRGVTSQISPDRRFSRQTARATVTSPKELQGNFWTSQTVFKHSIAAKLRACHHGELADDLEKCHTEKTVVKCCGCSRIRTFLNRCDKSYCPECQPRLSRQRKESVEWWTREVAQPKHVVLTTKNTPDFQQGHVSELKKWFTALRRSKFCGNWRGGFYSVEVTKEKGGQPIYDAVESSDDQGQPRFERVIKGYTAGGWHLHLHVLVDARYIDERELSRQWSRVTKGAGRIVRVKDCRDKSYMQEVTKYAVKGSDLAKWSGEDILAFIAAFDGARQFGVFGSLYGKRTEFAEWIKQCREDKSKCECGCSDQHFFTAFEWEVLQAQLTEQFKQTAPVQKPNKSLEFGFVRSIDQNSFTH